MHLSLSGAPSRVGYTYMATEYFDLFWQVPNPGSAPREPRMMILEQRRPRLSLVSLSCMKGSFSSAEDGQGRIGVALFFTSLARGTPGSKRTRAGLACALQHGIRKSMLCMRGIYLPRRVCWKCSPTSRPGIVDRGTGRVYKAMFHLQKAKLLFFIGNSALKH